MIIKKYIEKKLKLSFEPSYLEIHNESYKHNNILHLKGHYKIIIVSDHFIEQTLLSRHRAIYNKLEYEIVHNIHAIGLYAYTIEEWSFKQNKIFISPNCINKITLKT